MELSRLLDPTEAAPMQARALVGALSDRLPAPVYADLRTVLTELVTNSLKFGPGNPIRVWLSITADGEVRGEVADGGRGGAEIDYGRSPENGGLGLQIVHALCSKWRNPDGTGRVWFVLRESGD